MYSDEITLYKLIDTHKKRLRILELRAASQGVSTPPEILIEIQEIKEILQDLIHSKDIDSAETMTNANIPIKYYIYASETKIDMLYDQMPGVTTNLGSYTTRYHKLKKSLDFLENNCLIGECNSNKMYFKCNIPMKWTIICDDGDSPTYGGIVYFCGDLDDTKQVSIGLCGSLRHLIGYEGTNRHFDRLGLLQQKIKIGSDYMSFIQSAAYELHQTINHSIDENEADNYNNSGTLYTILRLNKRIEEGVQQVEFVARRLAQNTINDTLVILGTPLYVALAD